MIPNEIWMHIFEELDSPRDLAAVVRSGKRFKSLGFRVLYRHIVWSDPIKFLSNLPLLQQSLPLHSVTRALTLGISTHIPGQVERIEQLSRARATVHLTGDITPTHRFSRGHEARIMDEQGIVNQIDFLASDHLADAMYSHASSFTNLRELTFANMLLPDDFYAFVHHFPVLDKLIIENCTPPLQPNRTQSHPRDLPITELSIMGIRGRRDLRELRAFGEGQRLRVIRFDWTCYIYKHFCELPPPSLPNNWTQGFVVVLPPAGNNNALPLQPLPNFPQLQQHFPFSQDPVPSPHIHTIDVKFPTQKSWQSYVAEPHDQLVNPFAEFLAKCPRLANLRIRNYLPWLRLASDDLPDLAYYQGPLTTIKSVVSDRRRPKHLTIRDPSGGIVALEKAFKEIDAGVGKLDLETLSVFISWWDDEILYAILHHFRDLKRLEIMYREGDPTEGTVLRMGAHFFGKMPNLWSVRIFKVTPPGVEIAENLNTRGYPHRSIQVALGELIGDDAADRGELDEAEFDEAKFGTTSLASSQTANVEDQEELSLKELIQAWNSYCPALREVQLQAGYVWRRAGPGDVWTQRVTKVSRVRNAGFDEV